VEDDFISQLVALGNVFEWAIVLHNMPLFLDVVKVTVEKVHIVDDVVPLPTDKVFNLAQAFQTFIA